MQNLQRNITFKNVSTLHSCDLRALGGRETRLSHTH